MSKRKAIPNVTWCHVNGAKQPNVMVCERCGAEQFFPVPMDLRNVCVYLDGFMLMHRSCQPK